MSELISLLPPKLIAVTRTIETMTPEESIVYMARVSSPQNQDSHDTGYKLLRHCLINGHWSVFDMVDMTLEIWTSRAIAHQLIRHWSFRIQEFSQRYAAIPELIDWSHLEIRDKHKGGNRQGSAEVNEHLTEQAVSIAKAAEANYHYQIEQGAAPESARMIMPLATPTRMYVKGSVRTWLTYLWIRSEISQQGMKAQKEHRLLGNSIVPIFEEVFPLIATIAKEGSNVYVTNEERTVIEKLREAAKLAGN